MDKAYFYKIPISKTMLEDNGEYFIEKSIEKIEEAKNTKKIQVNDLEKELDILKKSLKEKNQLNSL